MELCLDDDGEKIIGVVTKIFVDGLLVLIIGKADAFALPLAQIRRTCMFIVGEANVNSESVMRSPREIRVKTGRTPVSESACF